MSWEKLSKDNAVSMAQIWHRDGKSDAVIREHLVTKGLSYSEADEVLAEINASPFKTDARANYGSLGQNTESTGKTGSLGQMATERIKSQDTPRGIAFNLWKAGKSKLYIQNNLLDRGFSNEEIDVTLRGLDEPGSSNPENLGNYGSLGKRRDSYGQVHYQDTSKNSIMSSQVMIGLVVLGLGCSATFLSQQTSTGGTLYIGAIIVGGWIVLKGLMKGG